MTDMLRHYRLASMDLRPDTVKGWVKTFSLIGEPELAALARTASVTLTDLHQRVRERERIAEQQAQARKAKIVAVLRPNETLEQFRASVDAAEVERRQRHGVEVEAVG